MKVHPVIVGASVILLAVYLCFTFIFFNFNVAQWSVFGRSAMILTWFVLSFIAYKYA